jgi:hypothetical protein
VNERLCSNCGRENLRANPRARFCSDRCSAASRARAKRKRDRDVLAPLTRYAEIAWQLVHDGEIEPSDAIAFLACVPFDHEDAA